MDTAFDAAEYAESNVKYDDVEVQLVGTDGNAFALIGKVAKAIRETHGLAAGNLFTEQAMDCRSYDELLVFIQQTVHVT